MGALYIYKTHQPGGSGTKVYYDVIADQPPLYGFISTSGILIWGANTDTQYTTCEYNDQSDFDAPYKHCYQVKVQVGSSVSGDTSKMFGIALQPGFLKEEYTTGTYWLENSAGDRLSEEVPIGQAITLESIDTDRDLFIDYTLRIVDTSSSYLYTIINGRKKPIIALKETNLAWSGQVFATPTS